jgi:serine/threonine protein kinase
METLIFYIFDLIKPFHERMLIHRDIKPENFIFDKKWNLYIIDLGLSTFVSNRKMYTFIGNKLYASFNCHKTEYIYEQNDDLISIVYMLLHLYTGILPWDNIHFDYKFNSESHSLFYDLKKNTNYKEFYKNIDKYDNEVKVLIHVYNQIIS